MIGERLNPSQAVRYVNTWLTRNNYSDLFLNDIALLLSENRRLTRSPNVAKYGRIPFLKDIKGRISYKLEDIQDLCNNAIKPTCSKRLAIKLMKAEAAAAKARLPYPEINDEQLDRLIDELERTTTAANHAN